MVLKGLTEGSAFVSTFYQKTCKMLQFLIVKITKLGVKFTLYLVNFEEL